MQSAELILPSVTPEIRFVHFWA